MSRVNCLEDDFIEWLSLKIPSSFQFINGFEILKQFFIDFNYDEQSFDRLEYQIFISDKRNLITCIEIWLSSFELNFEDYKEYFKIFIEEEILDKYEKKSFGSLYSDFKDEIHELGYLIDRKNINEHELKIIFLKSVEKSKANRILHKQIEASRFVKPKVEVLNWVKLQPVNAISKINKKSLIIEPTPACYCKKCNNLIPSIYENRKEISKGICLTCKISESKESKRNQNRRYKRKRFQNDASYRILHRLRTRILLVLQGKKKAESSLNLLGCTREELKKHLEEQFTEGMNWENYGIKGWHIDHILPCSSFDFSVIEEQKQCFHYTNLQPLWWQDNLAKSNKY